MLLQDQKPNNLLNEVNYLIQIIIIFAQNATHLYSCAMCRANTVQICDCPSRHSLCLYLIVRLRLSFLPSQTILHKWYSIERAFLFYGSSAGNNSTSAISNIELIDNCGKMLTHILIKIVHYMSDIIERKHNYTVSSLMEHALAINAFKVYAEDIMKGIIGNPIR